MPLARWQDILIELSAAVSVSDRNRTSDQGKGLNKSSSGCIEGTEDEKDSYII